MDEHQHNGRAATGSAADGPSRRRVLALGAASVGIAWATPSILSVDAASAATDPPPATGTLQGEVTVCGHGLDQGDTFLLTATQNPGGAVGSTTVPEAGSYQITGLPAGTYDIVLHPNGPANTGQPDESFPGAVVITAGGTATFSPDYQANGC